MATLGRLTKRPEYLRVAATRRKFVTPGVIVQVRRRCPGERDSGDSSPETPPEGEIRVGFTASRKVGNAVKRNRARRRLKAAAAEVLPEAGDPGFDYVLVARRGTLERGWQELLGDLSTALRRLSEGGGSKGRRGKRPPAGNQRREGA